MKRIRVGKVIDRSSELAGQFGAWGTMDRTVFECPCGKGTYVINKDNILGHRDKDYDLNCADCLSKYNFDPVTGDIIEKE